MSKPLVFSKPVSVKIGTAAFQERTRSRLQPKRKIRPTSFSLEDTFERSLNEWVSGTDFSRYVKRLIWADKQAGGRVLQGSSTLPKAQCHDVMTSNVEADLGAGNR